MDAAVVAANRALVARGYTSDEARVEPADDVETGRYRLVGSMLVDVHVDLPGQILRLVSLMPERDALAKAMDHPS